MTYNTINLPASFNKIQLTPAVTIDWKEKEKELDEMLVTKNFNQSVLKEYYLLARRELESDNPLTTELRQFIVKIVQCLTQGALDEKVMWSEEDIDVRLAEMNVMLENNQYDHKYLVQVYKDAKTKLNHSSRSLSVKTAQLMNILGTCMKKLSGIPPTEKPQDISEIVTTVDSMIVKKEFDFVYLMKSLESLNKTYTTPDEKELIAKIGQCLTKITIQKNIDLFDELWNDGHEISVALFNVPSQNNEGEKDALTILGRFVRAGLISYCQKNRVADISRNWHVQVSINWNRYFFTFKGAKHIIFDLTSMVWELLIDNYDISLEAINPNERVKMAKEIAKVMGCNLCDFNRLPTHGRLYKTNFSNISFLYKIEEVIKML